MTIDQAKHDPQGANDDFYHAILDAENKSHPLKTIKIEDDQPWMTIEIKKMLRERQLLYFRGDKNEWKVVANKIKTEIRRRKRDFFRKKYVVGKPNWWKEIDHFRLKSNNQSPKIEKLANSLNEGFYRVWNGESQPDINSYILPSHNSETIFTHSAIIKSLEQLKMSATGPDGLSSRLLKSAQKRELKSQGCNVHSVETPMKQRLE